MATSDEELTSVVGDRLARGLVRRFLRDSQSRWHASRSRFERFHWHGARNIRAAGRILDNVIRTLRPSFLAESHYVAADGSARLQVALLEPIGGCMPAAHIVAACVRVERIIIAPGHGIYGQSVTAPLAFTRHCLQRIVQRSIHWKDIRRELVPAISIAGPLLWKLAVQAEFRQILLLGHSGIFVGAPDSEGQRFVLTTFLPISAGARQRCDLVTELAGLLWLPEPDPYGQFLQSALDPRADDDSFQPVFEIYLRHAELLRRSHQPGADWFALAREQAGTES